MWQGVSALTSIGLLAHMNTSGDKQKRYPLEKEHDGTTS